MFSPERDARSAVAVRVARRVVIVFSVLCCCAAASAGPASSNAGRTLFAASVSYNVRAAHSGRCLDVSGGSGATANGARIQQWDCLGLSQSNQLWTFRPTGDGSTYYVTALSSGKCLDVAGGTTALTNGVELQQWDCLGYGQSNQRWQLVSTGDASTFYLKAAHSGKCLDVRGGTAATANGAVVQQWDCLGYAQANQRWYFTRGDAVPVTPDFDGDGSDFAHDCNDADGNIHPGAADIPGDGVDEDCNGSDATAAVNQQAPGQEPTSPTQAPPPSSQGTAVGEVKVLFVRVVNLWTFRGRATRLRKLALRGAPRSTRVTVTCRGHGCPFARQSRRTSNGHVDLGRPFKHRVLKPGTIVNLRLQIANIGRYVVRFQTRAGALPRRTDYCGSRRAAELRRCG